MSQRGGVDDRFSDGPPNEHGHRAILGIGFSHPGGARARRGTLADIEPGPGQGSVGQRLGSMPAADLDAAIHAAPWLVLLSGLVYASQWRPCPRIDGSGFEVINGLRSHLRESSVQHASEQRPHHQRTGDADWT